MNKTIAHLPADRAPRMIDLTRRLNLPYGSLTPGVDTPEPRWRIEARQDAEAFCWKAVGLMLGWVVGAALIFAVVAFLTIRQ